ncbi:fused MFS/spermidine synthase [Sphingomonas sp. MMS24-J13]|uniref:fused MFS/spermidine synthase n=1 Tax=Sphingomonas sp. MMS24-J13 TaxID=3238686 RepID=UPI00384EF11E
MTYPFDGIAMAEASRVGDSGSAASVLRRSQSDADAAQWRRDHAELNLLLDAAAALDHGRLAVVECLREHRVTPTDFPLVLDAPFGIDGPTLVELGDLRALLLSPAMTQSAMRISDPDRLIVDYTRVMMGFLLLRSAPRRIEMIGLGGGSLAKFCRRHLPTAAVTVVEIDSRVIALRDRFGVPRDDGHFRVINADGADFVREDHGRPDVILVDGFDARGQAQRLTSLAFYEACRDRLDDEGVLVVNLCDNLVARRIAKSRLRRVFGSGIVIVPIEHEQNRQVFASKHPAFPPRADQLLAAAAALGSRDGVDFRSLARRLAKRRNAVRAEIDPIEST